MKKTAFVTGFVAVLMVAGALYTATISKTSTQVGGSSQGAVVGIKSIKSATGLAAIFSADSKVITWNTSGFAAGETVDVNLIRKVSDNPTTYQLVRKLADNTRNDGTFTWSPKTGELEAGLFIEVTCSGNETVTGCAVNASPLSVK